VAVSMGLVTESAALQLAEIRPEGVELVFTGRYATENIVASADLVTEMREVKHYYDTEKLPARRGIEN
jgi:cob(I)alamin adenosyltransferase